MGYISDAIAQNSPLYARHPCQHRFVLGLPEIPVPHRPVHQPNGPNVTVRFDGSGVCRCALDEAQRHDGQRFRVVLAAVRHTLEREALGRRHEREKLDTAREKRTLSRVETREKASLAKALKKTARQVREMDNKLRQEFFEAARDQVVRGSTDIDEGDLQENFNDVAEFVEGLDKAGEEGDDRAPSWKERAENIRHGHKPKRGKGYGYRRDDK